MTSAGIGRWLDDAFARGVEEDWARRARGGPGVCRLAGFLDWPDIDALMSAPGADVLSARDGRLGPSPRGAAEARKAFARGWTIVARDTGRCHAGLAAVAGEAAERFASECRAQVYVTPGGCRGFGWHYDAEHVLILQTAGVKEYFFRANTVNPRPRLDAMPRDMRYELETSPVMACTLSAGDALYLPSGWWHRARALENSVSVSLGLLPRSAAGG